jgi:hypothetical protein
LQLGVAECGSAAVGQCDPPVYVCGSIVSRDRQNVISAPIQLRREV